MNLLKKYLKEFDRTDTLLVLSSFPHNGEEIAVRNAISRYSYLLVKNFPTNQKIVVLCERNGFFKPYKLGQNILVVPTYRYHSFLFARDVIGKTLQFKNAKNLLVQFEFSIFGGKIVVPQLVVALAALKLAGRSIKIMVHQVVSDVNTLSGHLGLNKKSFKSALINQAIAQFYKSLGLVTDRVLVHDVSLAKRMAKFVAKEKIEVIPHAMFKIEVLTNKFRSESKNYFGVSDDTKLITIFGYRSWYKGTDWMVKNFRKFLRNNPSMKVKLMVAGGDSPTLKGTASYKKYSEKFNYLVKKGNGSIISTGFVPEKDVKKVFAASDVVIFPYRTKMSASGAFSLVLGYGKKFLVSQPFSDNLKDTDFKKAMKENALDLSDLTFNLSYESFEKSLTKMLRSKALGEKISRVGRNLIDQRTWEQSALKYQEICLRGETLTAKLKYGALSYEPVK